jgi:hypothetical protein
MPCGFALVAARRSSLVRLIPLLVLLLMSSTPLAAQTIDDGIMLRKGTLFAGWVYSHDSWDEYWEGALARDNGNIGTVTTQANTLFGNYGVTDRLNVIATAPYIWTQASQGVLAGMQGFQDITLAAKYSLLEGGAGTLGSLRAMAVATAAFPLTDYTPDFAPMSIGSASKRLSGRFTLNTHSARGLYLNGSTAYTWRSGVTLDRPYYYTDGELFFTDEVDMPNVFDYVVSGGYVTRGLLATASFSQQYTLGGGDIRRQDMPFVSNRMNVSRVGAMIMAPIPKLHRLSFEFAWGYTVRGRNVGQATTLTGGLLYTLPFQARRTR